MKSKEIKLCLLLLLLSVFVFNGCKSSQSQTTGSAVNPNEPIISDSSLQTAAPDLSKLGDDEKKYFSAAAGYLNGVFEEDKNLQQVISNASRGGSSTLSGIKAALEHAQTDENALYSVDYSSAKVVPETFNEIDAKVQEVHKAHVAVYDEYLAFWRDNDIAHIVAATDKFKAAINLVDESVRQLTTSTTTKSK